MTCHITSNNRNQIIDLNNLCARSNENSKSGVAGSITGLNNDPSVFRAVKNFSCYPSQDKAISALQYALCMKNLPCDVVNAEMSEKGKSVKSLLGLIAGNISNEEDKKTLGRVYSQLIEARGDLEKEAEVGKDLNSLLIKYGKASLDGHVANFLDVCRHAWTSNHKIAGSLDDMDDNFIFSMSLLACHNVLENIIEKISEQRLDFNSIAQQADLFQGACASIAHTLINHDNQDTGPQERLPEPSRPKTLDPQVSAPASNGHGPINIHVEGSTANATINGNSSPTLTTPNLALIDFATKLVETRPEDLTETKVQLINKALDLIRDSHNRGDGGIIQNLQSVTPAQQVSSHEPVSANQRLAQVVQQPDTSAAEKPADSANSESQRMSAKRLQPLPLANDIAEIDFTEIDSAAAFSTAIVPKMIPGTRRQDLNQSAERNSTAPELKGKTTKPEQSETPAKLVETTQTEQVTYSVDKMVDLTSQVADAVDERSIREAPLLHAAKQVAESLSELSNNISVAMKQPSDSQAHPRDGMGIHSGGNPNNPLYSPSKDSGIDETKISTDNPSVDGGPRANFKKIADFFEKKYTRDHSNNTPFGAGNSISGNNNESGTKSSAERKSHQQNKNENSQSSTIGNSPRIYTTNRSFDPFNKRSTPSINYFRQFSSGSTGINKDESHKSENNIGEVVLDNRAMQYE